MRNLIVLIILISHQFLCAQLKFNFERHIVKDDNLILFNENHIINVDKNTLQIQDSLILKYHKDFNLIDYEPFLIDDTVYFYKVSGGLFLKLENDSLIRIDNSYDHRLHHKSLKFVKDSTLNILGGYGFFERRKIITYFDWENNEWIVKNLNNSEFNEGISNIKFHSIHNKKLLIFGFEKSSVFDVSETLFDNSVLQYDLESKNIKEIGELTSLFKRYPLDYHTHKNILVLLYQFKIHVINLETLKFKSIDIDFEADKIIDFNENKIIFSNRIDNERIFITRYTDKLIPNEFTMSVFQKNIFEEYGIYFLIIILLTTVFFIKVYLKRQIQNKLYLKGDSLFINKTRIDNFDKNEMDIIKLFFKREYILYNNDLLDFLSNTESNIGHQNRLKNEFIERINIKFQNFVTKKDLIIKTKNKIDKRQVDYVLNKDLIY